MIHQPSMNKGYQQCMLIKNRMSCMHYSNLECYSNYFVHIRWYSVNNSIHITALCWPPYENVYNESIKFHFVAAHGVGEDQGKAAAKESTRFLQKKSGGPRQSQNTTHQRGSLGSYHINNHYRIAVQIGICVGVLCIHRR